MDNRDTSIRTMRKPYKVKEYAERAGLSPNGVYQMIARGEIPAVRFGRAIRIPAEAGDKRLNGDST